MPNKITFYEGVQSQYDGLGAKDENGIYFLSDSQSIYKGNVKYGGSDINIATSSTAGIIKPGLDFDIAADGTLTLYEAMAINSFGHNSGTLELGSSINTSTFSWSLNKVPTKLTFTSGSQTTNLSLLQSSSSAISFNTPLTTTTTFKLQATDSRSTITEKSTTISFLNGKYYGVSTVNSADSINNSFVLGLTRQLASSRTGSFTVTANAKQYIYFAIPTSFGTPAFYVGGFEGGFSKIKTFNFTNASGYTVSYDVYKTTNAGLQKTTVEVK